MLKVQAIRTVGRAGVGGRKYNQRIRLLDNIEGGGGYTDHGTIL